MAPVDLVVPIALPVLSCVRVIFKENGVVGPENPKNFPASQGRTVPDREIGSPLRPLHAGSRQNAK